MKNPHLTLKANSRAYDRRLTYVEPACPEQSSRLEQNSMLYGFGAKMSIADQQPALKD